jgi:hypothetical protein
MATFTLKGIPDALLDRLRAAAERQHRSINGEILARLERSLGTTIQPADAIERARELRRAFRGKPVALRELEAARQAGRP